MSWMSNLRTAGKLSLGFGLMVVLLAAVAVAAYRGISAVERHSAFARALTALESNMNAHRADVLTMMAVAERSGQEALRRAIDDRTRESETFLQQARELARTDLPLLGRIEALSSARASFNQTRDTEVIPAILEGNLEKARTLALGIQNERYLAMRELGGRLAEEARQRSRQQARQALVTSLSVGLIALAAATAIVLVLTRAIANPLREISRVTERMGSGDLRVSLTLNQRGDEVGLLAQTFATMGENLRQQIGGMVEAATVLGAAASEIVVSTTQLSRELTALVQDTEADLRPALESLEEVLDVLNKNEDNIDDSLRLMAPFYRVFANTLGSGPWFDTYIQNFPLAPLPDVTDGGGIG